MLEQLSIFDEIVNEESHQNIDSQPIEEIPYIGQKAKLKMPTNPDCEVYQYMFYYCAHLMKRTGEITEITTNKDGQFICTLDFHGETVLFHSENLTLLY